MIWNQKVNLNFACNQQSDKTLWNLGVSYLSTTQNKVALFLSSKVYMIDWDYQ